MTHTPPIAIRAPAPYSTREIDLLRALGRLGAIPIDALHALLLPDRKRSSRYRVTHALLARGLIWRSGTPRAAGDGQPPAPTAGAVGLTVDGRQQLDALQIEPPGAVDRLLARDRRAPPPGEAALVRDTITSTWCASILDMARRTPLLVGATCQARAAVGAGELRLTLDAVLTLVFDPEQRALARPGWQIPWFDGEAVTPRQRVVRLALLVDDGRASTTTLVEQARVFAALAQANAYAEPFGGPLRPVLLVPPGSRGRQVAGAWTDAWPQTPALLSSTKHAQHPEYGALWGTYYTVKDRPAQQTTLLGGLVPSVEQWAQLTAGWTP